MSIAWPETPPVDLEAVALAWARECCSWRSADLADGRPDGGLWAGGSRPGLAEVRADTHGVHVTPYTPEAYATLLAWHAYWGPRRYRFPAGFHQADAPSEGPPRPRHDRGLTVRFTWGQLVRLHLTDLSAAAEPAQLALELDAAPTDLQEAA